MPEIIQEIKAIAEINVQILFKESNGYGSQWIWLCTGDPSCYAIGQNHTKKEAIKMAIDHLSIEHSAKIPDINKIFDASLYELEVGDFST